jgi:hypothetical protein
MPEIGVSDISPAYPTERTGFVWTRAAGDGYDDDDDFPDEDFDDDFDDDFEEELDEDFEEEDEVIPDGDDEEEFVGEEE